MERGFKAGVLVLFFLSSAVPLPASEEQGDFVFYQHDEDLEPSASSASLISPDPVPAAPSAEEIEREARMRELEERFKALSQSLGGMPAPPEVRNKKISFGDGAEAEAART